MTLYARLVREAKRQVIATQLAAHRGNVSATARTLGILRPNLSRLIRVLNVRG